MVSADPGTPSPVRRLHGHTGKGYFYGGETEDIFVGAGQIQYLQLTTGPRKHTIHHNEILCRTSELWRLSTQEPGQVRRPFRRKLQDSPACLPPAPHSP